MHAPDFSTTAFGGSCYYKLANTSRLLLYWFQQPWWLTQVTSINKRSMIVRSKRTARIYPITFHNRSFDAAAFTDDRPEIATETNSKFDNKRIVATLVYRLERNQVGVNVNSASWWALNSGAN